MNIKAGALLISAATLDDANFEQVVIFITEHNEKGAMGFVVNKLFARRLNALEEFKNSIPFPLYDGGPVDREHLFFIHRRSDLITQGIPVNDSIYVGGNFKLAIHALNNGSITANDIKIFVGYCGWDNTQLEEEIEEGSWVVVENESNVLFSLAVDGVWERLNKSRE